MRPVGKFGMAFKDIVLCFHTFDVIGPNSRTTWESFIGLPNKINPSVWPDFLSVCGCEFYGSWIISHCSLNNGTKTWRS